MGPLDIVIIAIVAVILGLCIRSLAKGKDECAGCGSSSSCSAKKDGGSCSAAQRMLEHASEALGDGPNTPAR